VSKVVYVWRVGVEPDPLRRLPARPRVLNRVGVVSDEKMRHRAPFDFLDGLAFCGKTIYAMQINRSKS